MRVRAGWLVEPMRALTVQQPWAWAIVHGGKLVENRTQAWSYRGPLAIHAGARWSVRGQASALIERAAVAARDRGVIESAGAVQVGDESVIVFGAIIGVVDLVDAHPASGCCEPWGEGEYRQASGDLRGVLRRDVVHLVLENPRPVVPIECKGRLGLWTPPADVLEALAL